ncbi:MAG: DUF389 domain-containing protein [Xenococcus sp. (in: cyanobacteria)]
MGSNRKINNSRIIKFYWLKFIRFLEQLLPKQVDEVDIRKLDRKLCQDATWNLNYIILTVSSCLIATFGLISNSTAVIIGAMLVAPLMLPLRALAFGALEGDLTLFKRAFLSILGATILALTLSYIAGDVANIPQFGSEVLSRTQPNLVDLGIAIVAGSISSFAKVRKGVSDVIAGTAIAVALMPPLCVVGLALSQQQLSYAKGASVLYLTNLLGITLSCMIVFILAGYTRINQALGWTLALTGILVLPLGASFVRLVRQAQLETGIINTLNETITVTEGVNDAIIEVDWTEQPPKVYILLQTEKEVFSNQVGLVEEFIEQKLGQSFKLVFFVNRFTEVTAEEETQTNIDENGLENTPQLDKETKPRIPIKTNIENDLENTPQLDKETKLEIPIKTNIENDLENILPTDKEINSETPLPIAPKTELETPLQYNLKTKQQTPIKTDTDLDPEITIQANPEIKLEAPKKSEPETRTESKESLEKKSISLPSILEQTTPSSEIPAFLRFNKPPKKKFSN